MAKRETKKQREAREYAALYERICDIMCAAQGEDPEKEDQFFLLVPSLPAVVRAVEMRLLPPDYQEKRGFLTDVHNMEQYETPKRLTDFLFRNSIRANSRG